MRALTPLAFQNEFLDRACFNLAVPLTRFEPRSSWPLTAADKFVSDYLRLEITSASSAIPKEGLFTSPAIVMGY